MPFTVQQLIEGRLKPITVALYDPAQSALKLMIEHDFSQLPVIDNDGKPIGMVTSDSILRALKNFGVGINALRVVHAIVKIHKYSADEDLFDLLDDLRDTYAVLIVDSESKLTGIVTSYDTTEYFRRQAEDMMFVEDIESMLKSYIRTAFTNENGDIDQISLKGVIAEITDADLRKKFQNALNHYLNLCNEKSDGINHENMNQVFIRHFVGKESNKTFDDLTLNEYIQLLLHQDKWPLFESIFLLNQEAVRSLLNSVRDTRNNLAHFRRELSPEQRQQLRDSKDWLARCESAVSKTVLMNTAVSIEPQVINPEESIEELSIASDTQIDDTPEEVPSPNESRYVLLASHLQNLPSTKDKASFTFKEIEEIIREELPASARHHPSWWTKEEPNHDPSQQWLDVGWRVSHIDVIEEKVIFIRIKEREEAYADFFTNLLTELDKLRPFTIRTPSPKGKSFLVIAGAPELGPIVAFLTFSFSRHKRFRVELYIDTNGSNKERNKQIFDALYKRKDEIENELKQTLNWERIDDKRASRIALYHPGAITDSEDELTVLRKWAVDTMIRFQKVMEQRIGEIRINQ